MKKYIFALALACLFLTSTAVAEIGVVTTIFPIFDWTREIVGDTGGASVSLLLDSAVDLHSYQPTAPDILKVASADVFIYVGGESDTWVEDVLQTANNSDMKAVNLLEALGGDALMEEAVEGMESDDDEDEEEADEHIWLSLRNAEKLVPVIAAALGEADPANAEAYAANARMYSEKLAALDAEYAEAISQAEYDTLLFGDRFPFRYLTEDYGLKYYAAFSGCSAETEASFETVAFLAGKVDELRLPAVLTIEGAAHRIAETVVENTQSKDAKLLTLNSMQGAADGSYLEIMADNLEVLKQALNR